MSSRFKNLLLYSLILILSRLPFINSGEIFFDSGEYLNRITNLSYFESLTVGHIPLHSGYPLLFWPIYSLFSSFGNETSNIIILFQILLALLGLLSFYYIVSAIFGKRTGLISLLFASFIPIFWITNVTVMMETTYTSLFFTSWFLILYGLIHKKHHVFLLSIPILSVSLLTHMAPLLWFPVVVMSIVIIKGRKAAIITSASLTVAFLIFATSNAFLINQNNIIEGFQRLFFDHMQERSIDPTSLVGIGRIIRNTFLPLLSNNTSIIFLGGIGGLLLLILKKNWKLSILLILWILPSIVTNQWWDSLLFGRHALIASFGLSIGISVLLQNRIRLLYIALIVLLFLSLSRMLLLTKPVPYIEIREQVMKLPNGSLYIESHFVRPQIQDVGGYNFFFVDEIGYDITGLEGKIEKELKIGNRVFVSSLALSEPYGLYSGPYLHPISLSYRKEHLLQTTFSNNIVFSEIKTLDIEDNLKLFEITINENSGTYPEITKLHESRRRLDYFDPLSILLRKLGII